MFGMILSRAVTLGVLLIVGPVFAQIDQPQITTDKKESPAPSVKETKLTVDLAKELLPPAAGIDNADFEEISIYPRLGVAKSVSLSLALLTLRPPQKPDAAMDEEFRYLGEDLHLSDIVKTIWISKNKGYASFIQPEYITACRCESTTERAEGVVTLKSDHFAGSIPFVAQATTDGWIITEFRLPHYKVEVVRDDDGIWNQVALNGAPTGARKNGARDKEVDDLQGEWGVVEWEEEGGLSEDLKGKKLLIKGDEITTIQAQLGLADRLSFKLALGKSPKEIDLTALNGWTKGMTHPGIYEIEGSRLRICYGVKVRPKEFATTPGSGLVMLTLERDGNGQPVLLKGAATLEKPRLITRELAPGAEVEVGDVTIELVQKWKAIELIQKLKTGMLGLGGTGRFVIQYEKMKIGGGEGESGRRENDVPQATGTSEGEHRGVTQVQRPGVRLPRRPDFRLDRGPPRCHPRDRPRCRHAGRGSIRSCLSNQSARFHRMCRRCEGHGTRCEPVRRQGGLPQSGPRRQIPEGHDRSLHRAQAGERQGRSRAARGQKGLADRVTGEQSHS